MANTPTSEEMRSILRVLSRTRSALYEIVDLGISEERLSKIKHILEDVDKVLDK